MSPPDSDIIRVQQIENAGRGVVAARTIHQDTLILTIPSPAVHVLFRNYRKEVCAQCFFYDRGRTLPVRDNSTGKVFCSRLCETQWTDLAGSVGVDAWQRFHAYVTSGSARKAPVADANSHSNGRPDADVVAEAYDHATAFMEKSRKAATRHLAAVPMEPDIMAWFLDAHLFYHRSPELWSSSIETLVQNPKPYATVEDLHVHCRSFQHLSQIPWPADCPFTPISPGICQVLETASSHNAFGINGGGEDAEEHMGYAVYPEASYFNHSCAPNLSKKRVGRAWEFRAATEIAEGEECCITYLGGDEKGLDVVARRARLEKIWGFTCMCLRCLIESGDLSRMS